MSSNTKRTKVKKCSDKEELESMEKPELIDKILKLEATNEQLRALVRKASNEKMGKKDETPKTPKRSFDFTRCEKRHIFLKFHYLGWNYDGFVSQEDTCNTIEHHLFSALTKSCCIESRETSNYNRCGRTDKGVSSFCQVISLDVRSVLKPEEQHELEKELKYCKILNRLLPESIRVLAWSPANEGFSARFDCKFRRYKYFFPRGNLDLAAMDEAAKRCVGSHDFRNLCKMDVANGVVEFKRTIKHARVSLRKSSATENSGYEMCELEITSQAFLWHQIRCLMGVLLLVGQRKESPDIISKLLDVERCQCKPQYNMAHEVPLNLWYCDYENVEWFIDQEELVNTVKVLQRDWTIDTVKSFMIENMLSELENWAGGKDLRFQSDCLLLGVQSKVYKPLMERETCESLESKIQRRDRKRKIVQE